MKKKLSSLALSLSLIAGLGSMVAGEAAAAPVKSNHSTTVNHSVINKNNSKKTIINNSKKVTKYYVTSKLAKSVGKSDMGFTMNSASVLTHGANSTLVMSFDKPMNIKLLKDKTHAGAANDSSIELNVLKNNSWSGSLTYDISTGKLSKENYSYDKGYYFTNFKTSVRFSGNTMSIDFPSSALSINASNDFSVQVSYWIDGGAAGGLKDEFNFTQAKTLNYPNR